MRDFERERRIKSCNQKDVGRVGVHNHVHVQDRGELNEATDLIALYGELAQFEAAQRADRSRSLGNVVHFCRWRQIERMIALLSAEEITGSVH